LGEEALTIVSNNVTSKKGKMNRYVTVKLHLPETIIKVTIRDAKVTM